ncbi:carboxypeptidase regulatory-like domain-containing protein [Pseudomonas gingeri]|uniref:Carboxypeptidase regulatory-like domain-containing protein n=1 Tax=Pseudomonas gingeri TaxID=117681 RepID=A0A7Y7Y859_9PSED|nr:carboxypeptidase regulatory-like domain-containing protein [Pseudomonas gingeri]NWA05264.1 carboxypeptidase regulatory-like domain-containing protein [Pseudomonas gingeri]NWA15061.1 carboxypeptidase regulatory-like domain-containing protein [Pseudomonas gingeri]NWA55774.1 carboxypeptidase regulatory-like domain-containing protein [Pseudomonas gingeri]NWA98515.1 carboxypeptidase regulatory-like domain-containing protein [Pseudomonas gingeri]NWB02832.1 carboxypeptidase regulatory-like domain-
MISVRFCRPTALAAVLLAVTVARVLAAPVVNEPINMDAVQLAPQQQNGVEYLTGGIGQDESQALIQTRGYNLHIVSSTGPKDEYLPDVNVTITRAGGEPVLSLIQAGPMIYVKLPAGKYQIVSSREGHEDRQSIVVDGKKTQTVNVHWNDGY